MNPQEMKSRRSTKKQRGSGYVTSQQFFDPTVKSPAAYPFASTVTTAPDAYAIRPVLNSTFQLGGRKTRRAGVQRAGFSPSVMSGFIPNAQAAIVPAAMYAAYHFLVPKKSSRKSGGSRKMHRRKSYRRRH
jgi:hypothetical protein